MLRKVLVVSMALAAIAAFSVVSQPVAAGSCVVLSEKAIGLKQAETAARAQKQLNRKIEHWKTKNGYKFVRTSKTSTDCGKKGGLVSCTATAKVCG